MSTEPVVKSDPSAVDAMPLNGIDHVEFLVGNAKQAAFYFCQAFGFHEVAYAGLETGVRDRASHVLRQGRITLVLTGALRSDHAIAAHQRKHGDGVKVIALSVPDVEHAYRHALEHGATGVEEPHEAPTSTGRCGWRPSPPTARRCTPSSTARTTRARSCRATPPARTRRRTPAC